MTTLTIGGAAEPSLKDLVAKGGTRAESIAKLKDGTGPNAVAGQIIARLAESGGDKALVHWMIDEIAIKNTPVPDLMFAYWIVVTGVFASVIGSVLDPKSADGPDLITALALEQVATTLPRILKEVAGLPKENDPTPDPETLNG